MELGWDCSHWRTDSLLLLHLFGASLPDRGRASAEKHTH